MFEKELFRVALISGPVDACNPEEEAGKVIWKAVNYYMATISRKGATNRHSLIYWWNENFATLRRFCIHARREAKRTNDKANIKHREANYKQARRELLKATKTSKRQ